MLCHIPTGGSSVANTSSTLNTISCHYATLVQRTQLQRIELDINCDTAGTFRIPFNSCMNYMPISSLFSGTYYGQTSYLRLFPYSSISAPSAATCGYTIWVSYEDVELLTAAGPQMGRVSKGMTESEREAEKNNIGPISSVFLSISKSLGELSPVPLIGDYASKSSWMMDRMSNAASIFGFSKPLNQSSSGFVKRIIAHNIGKVDGASDDSIKLASSNNNMVEVLPGFSGTDIDEMDFSFLNTIPSYVGTSTWNVAGQPAGTLLTWSLGFTVSPLAQITTTTSGSPFAQAHYTPMQFIATRFRYWRGSIVYTIKFVKTEFHSGRLMICYFPATTEDRGVSASFTSSSYVHRMVVDIRECNEITFRVPYVSNKPWKNTGPAYQDYSTGNIYVYVLDTLVAPATVTQSVTMLLEMSGGQDMEFAVPLSCPGQGSTAATQAVFQGVVPQMGLPDPDPTNNNCSLISADLGLSKVTPDDTISASACIGEKISSLRTLLKNFEQVTTAIAGGASNKWLDITPFGLVAYYYNGTAVINPNNSSDLYSILGQCYLYSRGGLRFKIYNNYINPVITGNTQNQFPITYISTNTGTSTGIFNTAAGDSAGNSVGFLGIASGQKVFHHTQQNGITEFEVPQYHQYHSRNNFEHLANNAPLDYKSLSSGADTLANQIAVSQYIGSKSNYDTNVMMFRAGAEDTNFGCFISIPPITYSTSVAWIAQ